MAILASELRIGNWVSSPLGELMVVKQIGVAGNIEYVSARNKDGFMQNCFNGIELTNEILKKCGFSRVTTGWDGGNGFNLYQNPKHPDKILPCYLENIASNTEIKSLHQLQNVFYALTNQELNFKPQ